MKRAKMFRRALWSVTAVMPAACTAQVEPSAATSETLTAQTSEAANPPTSPPPPNTPVPAAALGRASSQTDVTFNYWQWGADSSDQDKITFDNSQGMSTTLKVLSEKLNGGGCHYYWVGGGLRVPGASDIFVQIGYGQCGANAAAPFVYSQGSALPTSSGLHFFDTFPLKHGTWYDFSFQTDGVKKTDGTYNWGFYVQPVGHSRTKLITLPFESPNSSAPFVDSEVATIAPSSPCDDTADIDYDHGGALMALHKGHWTQIQHARSFYFYGPCSDANVTPHGFESIETGLGSAVTQTTAGGAPVW